MTYFHTLHSLSLSSILSLYPTLPLSLSPLLSQSAKSPPLVPAEQLQGRETQMEMFVENNMCIIKV